ncbi:MAG: DUF1178 family protein [Rhodospirillaceae bacterium]|nr:DUF1178 family protein [Rhodospirillaceae bacterium]
MIVFDLKCGKDHVFEAYFADSATYERQAEAGEIACPYCGDVEIAKAPMAPNIAVGNKARGEPETAPAPTPARKPTPPEMARAIGTLRRMRTHIEQNFDHVGERFPEEARKIHYGEVERRNIYGDATKEEVGELADEGIEVGEVPWVPRHDA